jgi:prepilin-type processing-associated H-X9-DG protein
LVELLSVILIIGILVAIFIAVVGRARESSKRAQCGSNLRQVSVAMLLHANDNNGYLPSIVGNTTPINTGRTWARALIDQGFISKSQCFACPADEASIDLAPKSNTLPCSFAPAYPAMTTASSLLKARKLLTVNNPSRVYMLVEWAGRYTDSAPGGAYWHSVDEGYATASDLISNTTTALNSTRHPGGSRHFAFMDGHVGYLDLATAQVQAPSSTWNGY